MEKLKFYFIVFASTLYSFGFSQVQVNKAIQFTGSGANAKVSGIQQYDQLNDGINTQGIQNSAATFSLAGGTANAIAVTLLPVPGGYTTGMAVQFIASASNTDSVTLNVNGLGPVSIKKNVSANLEPCDIATGQIVAVMYDGQHFQIISPLYAGVASIANAGPDQLNVAGTSTNLGASNPGNGTGMWNIISGSGGSIANTSNPSSTFSGNAGASYTLTWTVSPICGTGNTDTVIISFANSFSCGTSTVTDGSGNVYNTVSIGGQCWLQTNLETVKYQDGSDISSSDMKQWGVNGAPACNASNFNSSSCGVLYDGAVFQNAVSPCPVGFHIPDKNEFIALLSSVSNDSRRLFAAGAGCTGNCSGFNTYICGQIDNGGWEGCGTGDQIYYWTKPISNEFGWITQFNSGSGGVNYIQVISQYLTNYNYSIRCVQ